MNLPIENPPTGTPSSWLRLAYAKAQELRAGFADHFWSKGIARRDERFLGELVAKAQNLERLIYQAMQTTPLPAPLNGVQIIAAERTRQIEDEKYSAEHDDGHRRGELASAGACYAILGSTYSSHGFRGQEIEPPRQWPYENEWWKPSADPIRNLARAGALIAAEIDRLQRRAQKQTEETNG